MSTKRENKLNCCSIVQDLDVKHWDWNNDELALIQSDDTEGIAGAVKKRLEDKGAEIAEMYAIIHDKDVKNEWDIASESYVVAYVSHHIHMVIKFGKGKGLTLDEIAEAVGLPKQQILKAEPGRYGYDNLLSYLIHIKYEKKHQYDVDEVKTICGRDYKEIYCEEREMWMRGRAKKTADDAVKDVDWLRERILEGEIKLSEVLRNEEYYNIWSHNRPDCDKAFDSYSQRKIQLSIDRIESREIKTSIFFITGKSGAGKTYFTNRFASFIQEEAKKQGEDWDIYRSASTNPLDDYCGEDIVIMDDVRGSCMSASDWLHLLDYENCSANSARYHNKRVACRVVIINSTLDVVDFFFYMKGLGSDHSEAMDQFFRRIQSRVEVIPYDEERLVSIGDVQKTEEYYARPSDENAFISHPLTLHWNFDANKTLSDEKYGMVRLLNVVLENNRMNTIPYPEERELDYIDDEEADGSERQDAEKSSEDFSGSV